MKWTLFENSGGNILLVGHASSHDACAQQLTGGEPRSKEDYENLDIFVPYCEVSMLQENLDKNSKKLWTREETPFPRLTHGSTSCQYSNAQPILSRPISRN